MSEALEERASREVLERDEQIQQLQKDYDTLTAQEKKLELDVLGLRAEKGNLPKGITATVTGPLADSSYVNIIPPSGPSA